MERFGHPPGRSRSLYHMAGRHLAQVRAAALAAIGRAEAGHDRHSGHGLIDGALVAWIRRRQHDPFDMNFAAGEQVVDVPVFALCPTDVPLHTGPQPAGGAAGVDIRARREAKRAQATDLHADRD
jgi:hypothetical protein